MALGVLLTRTCAACAAVEGRDAIVALVHGVRIQIVDDRCLYNVGFEVCAVTERAGPAARSDELV